MSIAPSSLFKYITLLAGLLVCLVASGQPKDTLYFYNKTVLVGKLKSISLGYFEFDADGISILRIKNSKIESFHAQSRIFRVETTGDTVANGGFTRSSRPGWTIFHSGGKSVDVPIDEIASMGYYGRTFRTRIDGNAGAGYSYTKSSEIGRFNANGKIRYSSNKSLAVFEGDIITTWDSVKVEREREMAKLSYYYLFPRRWLAGGYANYQRNVELGLDWRLQEVLSAGRKIIFSPGQQGLIVTGVAVNQERNLEGVGNENTELLFQASYNLFSFEKPNASLSIVQTVYASATDRGRYRSDGDINLLWELIKNLSANLRFYHNYDSKSPATGAPNVDWGIVTGLTYKF
jgi:hypothetical protein